MREPFKNTVPSTLIGEENEGGRTVGADSHLARLYTPTLEEPWPHSLIHTIVETIRPPQLAPLLLTSQPIAVKEIWGLYRKDNKSSWMSLAIHNYRTVFLV